MVIVRIVDAYVRGEWGQGCVSECLTCGWKSVSQDVDAQLRAAEIHGDFLCGAEGREPVSL